MQARICLIWIAIAAAFVAAATPSAAAAQVVTNCPGSVVEDIRQREAQLKELEVELAGLPDRFRRDRDQRLTEEALASNERRAEIVRENVGLSQEAARNLREMIAQLERSIAELSAGCGPRTSAVPSRSVFDLALPLASDSTTFCTFRDGNAVFTPVFVTPVSDPTITPPETPQPSSPPTGEPPTTPPPSGGTPTGEGDPCEQLRRARAELDELRQIRMLYQLAVEGGAPVNSDAYFKSVERTDVLNALVSRLLPLCPDPPQPPSDTPPESFPPLILPPGIATPCDYLAEVEAELAAAGITRVLDLAMLNPEASDKYFNLLELRDRLVRECHRLEASNRPQSPIDPEGVPLIYAIDNAGPVSVDEIDPFPSLDDPALQCPDSGRCNEAQSTVPTNIFIKTTSYALDQGARAQETAGQVIRLFAPEQLDVALPTPGEGNQQALRSQQGHDADPLQGVTDSNGNAQLTAGLVDFFGNPGTTHHGCCDIEVTIDVTGQTTINLIRGPSPLEQLDDKDTFASHGVDPNGVIEPYTVGVYRIGEYMVDTLVYPTDLDELIRGYVAHAFPGTRVEENLCRIKEPAAITEYHACKLGDRAPTPGERLLVPPDPREELPGAALILPEASEWGQM